MFNLQFVFFVFFKDRIEKLREEEVEDTETTIDRGSYSGLITSFQR